MKNGGLSKIVNRPVKRMEHDRVRYPFIVSIPQPDGTIKRKAFACKNAAEAYIKRITKQ